jgi:hypothetical protein
MRKILNMAKRMRRRRMMKNIKNENEAGFILS